MRAAVYKEAGGLEVIAIKDVLGPNIDNNQVLVRVKAAGLNRADILQRKGLYLAPSNAPESIPGLEFAGIAEEVGQNVTGIRIGERVMGITAGGCQAEYVAADQGLVVPIPQSLDFINAAAIPEAYITASDAIFTQLQIKTGEKVLIHAVGSSVGIALLQLSKGLDCRVFGTSRTQEKLNKAKEMGLDTGINTKTHDFVEVIKKATGGKGVHACVDFIGAPILNKNFDVLADGGRLLILGLMGGVETTIDLNKLLSRRLKVMTTSMRKRPKEEKIEAVRIFMAKVFPLISQRKILPVVDRTFPLERLSEAQRYMEENRNFGKIIITTE